MDLARSGTSPAPSSPPTRLKPTSPSFVRLRMFQDSEKYARAGSIVSSTPDVVTVRVPPTCAASGPRTPVQTPPSPKAMLPVSDPKGIVVSDPDERSILVTEPPDSSDTHTESPPTTTPFGEPA